MADWVTLALIKRARGNRGEVAAVSQTNRLERFEELKQVFLFGPEDPEGRPARIESAWDHNGRLILKFEGVDSISDAEKLSGYEVKIPFEERPELPPDEYYHSDLAGCEMFDRRSGSLVGKVVAVHEYGGPLLLEVLPPASGQKQAETFLVPFARAICVVIDVAARRIDVELPEGLRD
ncbi:MAG: ribosome maturation factor RimM [Acidobacteria bacterium]|nr:ribosome maturation factor RimM [Acidobacteriota bacterium]